MTRAIAPSANTPDYARILEFCDIISRDGSGRAASTTAQCLVTIMKEESSYLVLFITLHAIERTCPLSHPRLVSMLSLSIVDCLS